MLFYILQQFKNIYRKEVIIEIFLGLSGVIMSTLCKSNTERIAGSVSAAFPMASFRPWF